MNRPVENIITPTQKVSAAWAPFQDKLAAILQSLVEDQYLIVSDKHSSKLVQFAHQGSFGMRVETLSNNYLPDEQKLNEQQISVLLDAGWLSPTKGVDSTPESDPEGSPNFFLEYPAPIPFCHVAELAVRTLSEILLISHPANLEYYCFDGSDGQEIELPALGLKHADRTPQGDISDLLLGTLKKTSGINDLSYDADGDIGCGYNSAYIYARLVCDKQYVRLFSIILCDIYESKDLYRPIPVYFC